MDESIIAAAVRETMEEAGVRGTIEVSDFMPQSCTADGSLKNRS